MTTDGSASRRHAAAVTTGAAAVATGVAVAWAAAHPVHVTTASTPPANPTVDPQALQRTTEQLAAARADLAQVRHDLAAVITAEDRLPRATDTSVPTTMVPTTTSVRLPAAPAAPAAAPAAAPVQQPAPPPVQANTGASGAH